MANTKAILVDLENFLYKSWKDDSICALQLFSSINVDALEFLQNLEGFDIIACCPISPQGEQSLHEFLKIIGINCKLRVSRKENYQELKKRQLFLTCKKYKTVQYIENFGETVWNNYKKN